MQSGISTTPLVDPGDTASDPGVNDTATGLQAGAASTNLRAERSATDLRSDGLSSANAADADELVALTSAEPAPSRRLSSPLTEFGPSTLDNKLSFASKALSDAIRPQRLSESLRPPLSVVVPVYNEAVCLLEFHRRLKNVLTDWCNADPLRSRAWEVVYVNDGSTDASAALLRQLAEEDRHVVVVNFRRNFGQTAALSAGMDHASGQVLITMDGDLQHLPEEIPLFMAKIADGHDMVLGYRANRRDNWLMRRVPSRCANWMMRRLSGVEVRDFGSTFKAFRRDVVGEFEMFGDVHRFMPVLGAMAGCDMAEVPITNAPRHGGVSNYGLRRVFGVAVDILMLGFFSSYLTRPGRPWGCLGLLTGGFGIAIQATLLFLYVTGLLYTPLERPGWLMLSVLMECVGLQCLGFGVMCELLGRTYFASRQKPIYSVRSILGRAARRKAEG